MPAIHLPDAAATECAGAALASALRGGVLITLKGDLAAGKTTLARGVLRELGWTGAVKSPTYTLVEHYFVSSLYFYHFDFYRFANPEEWETAGLAEYFRSDAVCLVEWPERVAGLLPVPDVELALAHCEHPNAGRDLFIHPATPAGERCKSAIAAVMKRWPTLP
ncbi:MAG: tRNA (adenosine(37)-N6)-threonylcarbamoyltransferase complex ATPase subunit type 1 TsaE [Betaproteobacteria bacterium]|nr:tRNA (adenosine(37)-N6)-threonylcarbamoyltransferase complex ATPase subunit type 1 TsaE [Betaproteobacteria bacterium]MBA3774848.1 tRNA (adenosine(37)-N6)-threonylcarbamoyltransferase complex ATPase subunit type 1 TsaE [Betaproteobacteria bacterium]